ncbi:hypothetical protein BGZ49_000110 [Haplosporangium sp. Z 27]|nr:hypothetical protein BGZ49_000110 [Haplosporangium sp. Z 27]
MSYARLNNSSDSEDEAPTSPSAHVRRTSSAAAASLASLIQSNGPRIHEYSQLSNDVVEEEESTSRNDAATVDHHELENNDSENDIEIHVRFGESKDLKLRVPRTDTIAQVKEKVKLANEAVGDKYMRLIYAGKILSDNKTLMESLPKSLFTQVEVPHHHDFHDLQSKLSSSVEAVEAAASNILAGISSRTGGGNKTVDGSQSTVRAQTSLGSILPTHITYPSSNNNQSENSTESTDANATTPRSPSRDNGNHVSIAITSEPSSPQSSKLSSRDNKRQNVRSTSTIKIPVQTGPIYFLCSLSDFPPAQPPSNVKKGKAVATNDSTRSIRSNRNRNTAAATTARAGSASSPLALPRRGHSSSNGEGPSSRTTEGVTGDDGDVEDENDDEAQSEEELSPTMTPQPTGFDRLREAGFSEDEIRAIRRQFHARRETQASSVGENGIAVELDQDEDTRARARRIEEEWIDQHGAETLPEGRK